MEFNGLIVRLAHHCRHVHHETMIKTNFLFALPVLALVAACDTAVLPAPGPAGADTCGAAQFGTLIGQPVGNGGPFLDSGKTYRVIYPDDAVTTDFSAERLNVKVDGSGVIQSINCG